MLVSVHGLNVTVVTQPYHILCTIWSGSLDVLRYGTCRKEKGDKNERHRHRAPHPYLFQFFSFCAYLVAEVLSYDP